MNQPVRLQLGHISADAVERMNLLYGDSIRTWLDDSADRAFSVQFSTLLKIED